MTTINIVGICIAALTGAVGGTIGSILRLRLKRGLDVKSYLKALRTLLALIIVAASVAMWMMSMGIEFRWWFVLLPIAPVVLLILAILRPALFANVTSPIGEKKG